MITVENISLRIGHFALDDISFEIPSGRYGFLMGKTGCGKTSILEAICGLRGVHGGRIRLLGKDVTRLSPAQREIGYVPQDGALFSTMTVRDNLAFALVVRQGRPEAIARRISELAELLGIRHLLERRPAGLSGGEAQRVALGRALACRPHVLCLDEPLSALDEETRSETGALLRRVSEQMGVTTLHVTHSLEEAKKMGDIIFRLKEGRISHEYQERRLERNTSDSPGQASLPRAHAEPSPATGDDL